MVPSRSSRVESRCDSPTSDDVLHDLARRLPPGRSVERSKCCEARTHCRRGIRVSEARAPRLAPRSYRAPDRLARGSCAGRSRSHVLRDGRSGRTRSPASKGFFPKEPRMSRSSPMGRSSRAGRAQDSSHRWFGVYRWLPNGDLDRSFGSGGWVANDLGAFPMPHTVALQTDGKILVGGQIECPGLQLCFGIVRYNLNGSIDGSFGVFGVRTGDVSGLAVWLRPPRPRRAAERADRRRRLAAPRRRCSGRHAPGSGTLPPDGRLDRSFVDGRLSFDGSAIHDFGSAVVAARRQGRRRRHGAVSISDGERLPGRAASRERNA